MKIDILTTPLHEFLIETTCREILRETSGYMVIPVEDGLPYQGGPLRIIEHIRLPLKRK